MCERRTTFAKAYEIKVRCYGEHVGEYIIGNRMRTCWEHSGNQRKPESSSDTPPSTKMKKCKAP
jgi:hypothetical protein